MCAGFTLAVSRVWSTNCAFLLFGGWQADGSPFLFLDDTERYQRPWAGFDRLIEFGKRRWIWWWRGIYIHPELSDCLRDR